MANLNKALKLLKGMWIWQWDTVAPRWGGASGLITLARNLGLDHYCIKIADGRQAPYDHGKTFGRAQCQALRDAGLFVWGWQYTYGRYPAEEAEAFVQQANKVGVDGIIVDAEEEYKDHADRARTYCAALKTDLPVALSSYYIPSYHASFPWSVFAARADITMPQIYWYGRDVQWAVSRSLREYRAFGKPVQVTYGITSDICQGVTKLRAGHALADEEGVCVNYWVLDSTGAAYRETIAAWHRETAHEEDDLGAHPSPGAPIKVILLPGTRVIECNAIFDGQRVRGDLRPLVEALGYDAIAHLRMGDPAGPCKLYIRARPSGT